MVDQDYKKNKVTVCAHLQNIYNSFGAKRGKPTLATTNYFDIEKWNNRLNGIQQKQDSPAKELRRNNTLAKINNEEEQPRERENYLLSKSNSTWHIPESSRAKNTKRVYANYDKELAVKMFGYRVLFKKKHMEYRVPDPSAP